MKVWHYLFEDGDSGERFFVEASTMTEAVDIIDSGTDFDSEDCDFVEKMAPEESEWYPYDVY